MKVHYLTSDCRLIEITSACVEEKLQRIRGDVYVVETLDGDFIEDFGNSEDKAKRFVHFLYEEMRAGYAATNIDKYHERYRPAVREQTGTGEQPIVGTDGDKP